MTCTGPRLHPTTDQSRAADTYERLVRDPDAPVAFNLCRNDPKIWLAVFQGRLFNCFPDGDQTGTVMMRERLRENVNG